MGGMKETLGTRPDSGAQPLVDRRAVLVSQRNYVDVLLGDHRSPLVGQIKEMLAFLGRRSILCERVAKGRKTFKFSLIAGHD